jgi:hypothetical protein
MVKSANQCVNRNEAMIRHFGHNEMPHPQTPKSSLGEAVLARERAFVQRARQQLSLPDEKANGSSRSTDENASLLRTKAHKAKYDS